MPISKHSQSRRQQGYLFGVLGGPSWAHRWYKGVASKKLPAAVRGPKTRAKSRQVISAANRRRR